MADLTSLDDLRESITGKSDDEINAGVADMGVDRLLGQILEGMAARFQPEKAAGQSAVIGWDIVAPDGVHGYQLKVADGACGVQPTGDDPARVTLKLSLPDFLRMITGQLDGMQAFMTGKLQLSGDMMFAQAVQTWFGA